DPENPALLLCDFEYCSYGARAYDITLYLSEWDNPISEVSESNMPSTEVIEHFLEFYLEGCDIYKPGYSKQPGNSLPELMREVKVYYLVYYMLFACFMLNVRESFIKNRPFDDKFKMVS